MDHTTTYHEAELCDHGDKLTSELRELGIVFGAQVPGTEVPIDPCYNAMSELVLPISLSRTIAAL